MEQPDYLYDSNDYVNAYRSMLNFSMDTIGAMNPN